MPAGVSKLLTSSELFRKEASQFGRLPLKVRKVQSCNILAPLRDECLADLVG